MTLAPLVLKDKVIVGVAGGEYGIRGFLDAYDAKSGAELWRRPGGSGVIGGPASYSVDGEQYIVVTAGMGGAYALMSAFDSQKFGWRYGEGRRVLAKGRSSLVVPWSERTRYSGKKNGYHGGVSPQEMVLPLAVLTWGENALEGFREVVNLYPSWWFEASAVPAAQPRPARPTAGIKPGKPTPTMFDLLETEKPTAAPSWLDRLFTSPVLLEQKALSQGRGIPSDDEVRRLLLALAERGGRITRVALAQRMGVPPFRLAGLVAATRRLLNVDGLQVLDVDDASDTVILNRPLLEQQFEVDVR